MKLRTDIQLTSLQALFCLLDHIIHLRNQVAREDKVVSGETGIGSLVRKEKGRKGIPRVD